MSEIRNIILIGRTGNGKSALANVIGNIDKFKESDLGVSETHIHFEEIEVGGINYRIIDTIGLCDTSMSEQEVIDIIVDVVYGVIDINQILFVTSNRFTEEEIDAYDLLSVIFDENISKYTTIVRTRFSSFRKPELCNEDKKALIKENSKLAEVIISCNKIIHVDNPSIIDIEDENEMAMKKRTRERSRTILLTHLYTCRENFKPGNPGNLYERIEYHRTEKERLQRELNEMKEKVDEWEKKFGELSQQVEEVKREMESLEQRHEQEKNEMRRRINEARR
ncbi:hypothetical protein Glove_529g54 [Diversispora epigaea]|uniref:AIG1-type G domain-containing protein n=1 Tax=Diversispora epigaea TaxID=1348612 RepID=A0A397GI52_9GLOM|nr:hypothetical protein Glove_529g54 [Diversispora epigaea]